MIGGQTIGECQICGQTTPDTCGHSVSICVQNLKEDRHVLTADNERYVKALEYIAYQGHPARQPKNVAREALKVSKGEGGL